MLAVVAEKPAPLSRSNAPANAALAVRVSTKVNTSRFMRGFPGKEPFCAGPCSQKLNKNLKIVVDANNKKARSRLRAFF